MTSREQFEEWFSNDVVGADVTFPDFEDGEYIAGEVYDDQLYIMLQAMWMAWKASRAAVEIKLPNQACLATWHYAGSPPDDFYEDIEISRKPSEDKSFDGTEPFPLLTKWEVEQAIESAGLKVKGD
ncbi:hypothetical protein [Citrobacter freundii]|uniref:hypothetical protein n=1 Tax=Citrobacter freundii TaxID=546 RepID=UPI00174DFA20|nr:hypothetical protein [Citrobacter freundii]